MSKAEEQIFLGNLKAKGIEIIVDKDLAPITDMKSLKKSLENKETRKKIKISVESLQKFYEAFAEYIQKDFVFEGFLANKISNGLFTNGLSKSQNIRDFEFKYGVRIYSFESDIVKGLTEAKLIEYVKSGKIKLIVSNLKVLNDNKNELPELEEIFNELITERNKYLNIAPKQEKPNDNSNTSVPTKVEEQSAKEPKQKTTSKKQTAPQASTKKQQSKQSKQPQQPQKNQKTQKTTPSSNQNNNLIEINSLDGKGIKGYKKIIDELLKTRYIEYGKDAAILAFEQYYEKKGSISRVKINNKEYEFIGEDRALKVLNAKYVEYVLNFVNNKDKNFYDLSPKERRLFEGILAMYSARYSDLEAKGLDTKKIPEEIVKFLTDYIRDPAKIEEKAKESSYKIPEMQGISAKDIVGIMVSSEIDRMIEKEQGIAKKEDRDPKFKKSPLEEKLDAFSNSSDNIQISAIRYIDSATSYDKSPNKSTARANLQANKTQLLHRLIENVDKISIIPNLDLKKLRLELESLDKSSDKTLNLKVMDPDSEVSNLEKLNSDPGMFIKQREHRNEDGTIEMEKFMPKTTSLENLNSYLESSTTLETLKFDSKQSYPEKQKTAEEYIQRAADMYIVLKGMIEQTKNTITERKASSMSTKEYEKVLENLLNIYERMMANGNDRLISNYIAISEAQKKIEQSRDNSKRHESKDETLTR